MLRQSISHRLYQKLSPQQIQLMKLLQIPTATLDQRIKEELEANPALDEGMDQETIDEFGAKEDALNDEEFSDTPKEDFELDDYINEYIEDDPSSYKLGGSNFVQTDEDDKTIPVTVESTYHEYLEKQLGLLTFKNDEEKIIAEQLIGSIDEDGYLRRDLLSIVDDLAFAQNVMCNVEKLEEILKRIQGFDPPGTGCRDLRECLLIQLNHKLKIKDFDFEEELSLKLAIRLIQDYFEEFSKKHFQKLQRYMNITNDDLKEAINVILKLNPKPASGYTADYNKKANMYIVPDFILANRDGELELSLNTKNAPELRINDQYVDMLKTYNVNKKVKRNTRQEKDTIVFIKQKIDSAKWFIDAIRQRQETMYKSMYSILQYQYDYFLTGDQKKMRPMILKDIADITGLDISTVSRVANSKFVQTEFGTMKLKDFFSESLQTADGEEVSTLEVKKILTEIIAGEDKKKPLSDEKLKKY